MAGLVATGTVRITGQAFDTLSGAITSGHGSGAGGGGNGPSFVPALNTLAIVGLNTLNSVDPCPSGACGYQSGGSYQNIIRAWNSGLFADAFSTLGAYIIGGGGDHDYWGNQLMVFPFDDYTDIHGVFHPALTWFLLTGSGPSNLAGPAGYADPGSDHTRGTWPDNTPWMPHTYDAVLYLPPTMGGGSKGSWLMPIKTYGYLQNSSPWAHKCDLATGVWSDACVNQCSTRNESTWFMDTTRHQAVGFQTISNAIDRLLILGGFDSNGVGGHSDKFGQNFELNHESVSEYLANIDAGIAYGQLNEGLYQLIGLDRANNDAMHPLATTGDALPVCVGAGICVVPDYGPRGAIFMRSTNAAEIQNVWRIEPPGTNWQGNPWQVTKITMAGAAVQGLSTNGIFKRLRYAKSIGCLVWVDDCGTGVHLYAVTAPAGRSGGLVTILSPATLQGLGHNGTNTVNYSMTLVPWNGSFSTLASSKHACATVMGDGNAYLFPKDCSSQTFPAERNNDSSGNQEMYRFNLVGPARNTMDIVYPYWIPDNTLLQANNPDDAFTIRRINPNTGEDELYYFFSVTTVSPDPPGMHVAPDGNYAQQIPPETYVSAWKPPYAGGDARYGTWRIAGPAHTRFQADRAWRGYWDPVYDEFVIPCNLGGQTGFLILDGETLADKSDYESGVLWSFGQFTGYSNGVAYDFATRMIYMFDNLSINLGRTSMDAIHFHDRGQAFPQPFVTLDASLRGTIPDQYGGKICFANSIRAVVFPLHETWYAYRPDNGSMSVFPRQDGRFSDYDLVGGQDTYVGPGNGPWINSYDTFEDPSTGDIITYSWIDFHAGAIQNHSLMGGWCRNHFTLA